MENNVCILPHDDSKERFENPKDAFDVVDCNNGNIVFEGTLQDCKAKYPEYINKMP